MIKFAIIKFFNFAKKGKEKTNRKKIVLTRSILVRFLHIFAFRVKMRHVVRKANVSNKQF